MKTFKILLLGTLGVILSFSCSNNTPGKAIYEAVPVTIYKPSRESNNGFYLSGKVIAKQTATISTRIMGYIDKIYVNPGDRVHAGQLLVSINKDDITAKKAQAEAMVLEAEAAAKNARKDHDRFKVLHTQSSVSDKELENISLQHTSMKAKAQMAHQQMNEVNAILTYANIKAPFSGVITQKMINEGSLANPGIPILMLEQDNDLEITASVPENYIGQVSVGDSALIEFTSSGITTEGVVSELSPSAYATGGQYGMKITFRSQEYSNIYPGMYANLLLFSNNNDQSSHRILVDQSSIIYRDQLTGVYIVNDKQEAVLRWVRLGKAVGNQVEVLSGIDQDDKIIREAEGKLHNGKKVTII